MTEREHPVEELRGGQEAYERQYSALAALTRRGILQTTDQESALREITHSTADTLGVERVSVWHLTEEGDAIVAYDLFERSAARHSSGHTLEAATFPAYFSAVANGDVLVADDAERDPRTREFTESYLIPNRITSMLDAPILVGGEFAGVLCLEHVGPRRTWTAGERSFAVSAANLTALILAQQSLLESQRRLSTLMDHLPGMAYRCRHEPGWPTEFLSDGALALTGYDPAELLGDGPRSFAELIDPADRDRLWEEVDAAVKAHEPYEVEYRIVTARGTEKWVWERGQAVHGPDGHPIILEGFIADITQRKRDGDALRNSEERFRLLARATSDAIWDWDMAANTVWWSEGAEALFGLSREELGVHVDAWTERIHPDDRDRVTEKLQRTVEADVETFMADYRFRRGDGSYADVLDRGYIIRDAQGNGVRMIGGMSDLTERKRLEGQLLHSQKMESVGRLAGGIAHDFNNLLTVILGTVDLAVSEMAPEEPLAAELDQIRNAAARAAGLTQQLLAFSRRQVLQPRVLDINEAISGTLAMLRRLIGEDIEIRFTPGADLWHVRADPGQLEQVLFNLAVNARDAMLTGGLLSIATRNVTVDEAYAAVDPAARSGPHVSITISDSGVGMDAATRNHAFEPFYTTKAVGKGTGLGLATVYGIVQQSGGSINLYSELGRGTTFNILLPRAGDGVQSETPTRPASIEGGSETILLVEDDPAVRRLTERVLSTAGYTVLAEASGAEAMATVTTHEGPVHLLLTDVVMPETNGPELARMVAEKSPSTRVLFMSGYTDDAMVRHGVPAGQSRFLGKPFTIAELTHAVRAALSS